MADLTFTDMMLKNRFLRHCGESFASDFQCLLCLAFEKYRQFTPRLKKSYLELLVRLSCDGGWPHPDCIAFLLFTKSHSGGKK